MMEEEEHRRLAQVRAFNSLLQSELRKELLEQERMHKHTILKHDEKVREVKRELLQIKQKPTNDSKAQRKAEQICSKKKREILRERKMRSCLNQAAEDQARSLLDRQQKQMLPERGALLREVHEKFETKEPEKTGYSNFVLFSKTTFKHTKGFSKV